MDDLKSLLWRAIAMFRIVSCGYAALLTFHDAHDYFHPTAGDAVIAVMAFWSVAFAVRFIAFLSTHPDQRRDDRLISTIAILGRGMILLLLAQLSIRDLGPGIFFSLPLIGLSTALVLAQAYAMARQGPRTRATVPAHFEESAAPTDPAVIS